VTRRRRYRRRPRLYLRGHLGCLGCSVPLFIALIVVSITLVVMFG
jgi:hypothetical protein